MGSKDSAHRQNPLACGSIAKKIENESQGTKHALIPYDPPRLQQAHRRMILRLDHESLLFEQTTPLGTREWPGAVVDHLGQIMLNGTLAVFVQVVGRQA